MMDNREVFCDIHNGLNRHSSEVYMNEINPIERIQTLCKERNWSYYQLSKASGIAYSTLNTMLNKENMPTLPTLLKLCQGFGISLTDFFEPDRNRKGLTEEQTECLSLFTTLPPDDRRLAISYMKGLLKVL